MTSKRAEHRTYTMAEAKAIMAIEREDYRSPLGIATWWQKDGAWHIALPYSDGFGFRWSEEAFDTKAEAIAAIQNNKGAKAE